MSAPTSAPSLQLEVPVTNYTLALSFLRTKALVRLQNELVETEHAILKRYLIEAATNNRMIFNVPLDQLKQTWNDLVKQASVYRFLMSLTNDLILHLGQTRFEALVQELRYANMQTFAVDFKNQDTANSLDVFDRSVLDPRTMSMFGSITDAAQSLDMSKYPWFITLHLLSALDIVKDVAAQQVLTSLDG